MIAERTIRKIQQQRFYSKTDDRIQIKELFGVEFFSDVC